MCALFIFATPDQVNDGGFMCQVACNTTQIEPTPGVARVRRAQALSTDIVAIADTIHISCAHACLTHISCFVCGVCHLNQGIVIFFLFVNESSVFLHPIN